MLGIGPCGPQIKSLKLLNGEELVSIVIRRGRRRTILAVPMKIVHDDAGAVHLVPWMTATVRTENDSFMWSEQPFEVRTETIVAEAWPLSVVRNEYKARLNDPQTWLNNQGKDIDLFAVPDNMKIQ